MRKRDAEGAGPAGPGDDPDSENAGEPMSAAQRAYLRALAEEAGVPFQGDLTRDEAARRIQELQDEVERLRGERKKG